MRALPASRTTLLAASVVLCMTPLSACSDSGGGDETGETGETGEDTGETGDEPGETGDEPGETGDDTGETDAVGDVVVAADATGDSPDDAGPSDPGDTTDTAETPDAADMADAMTESDGESPLDAAPTPDVPADLDVADDGAGPEDTAGTADVEPTPDSTSGDPDAAAEDDVMVDLDVALGDDAIVTDDASIDDVTPDEDAANPGTPGDAVDDDAPTEPSCCDEIVCGPGKMCTDEICDCVLICCTDEECAADGLVCDPSVCECVPGLGSECPAFLEEEDPCIEGTWCEPTEESPESGDMLGECAPADGTLGQFNVCGADFGQCMPGLGCVDTTADYQACFVYCDPDASHEGDPGLCLDEGQICSVVPETQEDGSIIGAPDYGYCQAGCIPWLAPTLTDCAETEWCAPLNLNANAGACVPIAGDGHAGDACGDLTGVACGAGMICLGGECTFLCDVAAPPGTPGATCKPTEACGGLQLNNPDGTTWPIEVGACLDSCDFHLDVPCAAEEMSCSPGELFAADSDICVTPPDYMPEWPMPEFEPCPVEAEQGTLCGPNSVCLVAEFVGGPGIRCYDLCIESAGPLEQANHPDCRRDTALCMDVFAAGSGFGLCGPDVAP